MPSNYLTTERVMVGFATLTLIMVGWFFTLVVAATQDYRAQLNDLVQRMAVLETKVKHAPPCPK